VCVCVCVCGGALCLFMVVRITTPLVAVADYLMTPHKSQKRLDEFEPHIICGTKSKFIKTVRSLKFI